MNTADFYPQDLGPANAFQSCAPLNDVSIGQPSGNGEQRCTYRRQVARACESHVDHYRINARTTSHVPYIWARPRNSAVGSRYCEDASPSIIGPVTLMAQRLLRSKFERLGDPDHVLKEAKHDRWRHRNRLFRGARAVI